MKKIKIKNQSENPVVLGRLVVPSGATYSVDALAYEDLKSAKAGKAGKWWISTGLEVIGLKTKAKKKTAAELIAEEQKKKLELAAQKARETINEQLKRMQFPRSPW